MKAKVGDGKKASKPRQTTSRGWGGLADVITALKEMTMNKAKPEN